MSANNFIRFSSKVTNTYNFKLVRDVNGNTIKRFGVDGFIREELYFMLAKVYRDTRLLGEYDLRCIVCRTGDIAVFANNVERGFFGTSRGEFLRNLNEAEKFGEFFWPKFYYRSNNVKFDFEFSPEYDGVPGYKLETDIVKYDPVDLFSPDCKYNIMISTSPSSDCTNYRTNSIRLFDIEGINTDILAFHEDNKLFDPGKYPSLDDFIENYKFLNHGMVLNPIE